MTVGLLFHRIKHFRAMGGSGSNLDNWIFLGKYLQMSPTKLVTNHYGGSSHWAPRLDSIKTNLDKQIFETLKIVCDSQEFIQFWANSLTARYRKVGIVLSSQVNSGLTVIENLIPSWVETRDSIWYFGCLVWEQYQQYNPTYHCSVLIRLVSWFWVIQQTETEVNPTFNWLLGFTRRFHDTHLYLPKTLEAIYKDATG